MENHHVAPVVRQSTKSFRPEKWAGIPAGCLARIIRVSTGEDWQNPGSGSWIGSVIVDPGRVRSVMGAKKEEEEWKC